MRKLQYSLSMDQLEKLGRSPLQQDEKIYITQILKISIDLMYLTGCVLKRTRKLI